MINFAEKSDIPQLKKLWSIAFGEGDREFSDFYFDRFFESKTCLVNKSENEIYSAVYLFRGYLKSAGSSKAALFIYAAATFPQYGGKGHMRELIQGLFEYGRNNGYEVCCTVSALDCMALYEKCGMKICTYLNTAEVVPSHEKPLHYGICPETEFFKMRREFTCKMASCLDWDDASLKFMYEYINFCGAMLETVIDGRSYYAAVTDEGDSLIIRETNAPEKYFGLIAAAAAERLGMKDIYVYSAEPCTMYKSEKMYYGHAIMLDGSELTPCYINLIAE
ncbi:MAG: GNAT family N-acetyltransferase [Huintestinicola sp.]